MAWSRGALAATILWSLWQTSWADILPSVRSRADVRAFPRGPEVPDDAALEASGAIVGTVRHVRLNVFDTTIPAEDTALFRVANRIHIVSRESTLGAQLLFRSGERYEGRLLEESERVLRSKAYLADARIRPVSYRDGRVDIEVVTQDTWTLRPEVHFARTGGENTSGFGIEEHNLFGTGAQLGLAFKSGVERDSNVLVYKDANVGGSRWRIDADYAKSSDGWAKRFALDPPFYALDTRWASGIGLRDERRIDSVYEGGQVIHQFATHERVGTVYVGGSRGLRDGWATRWTTGVSIDQRWATALPDALPGSPLPKDRELVYPWVGVEWVEDDYRVSRNQDQIARTEDVALGWRNWLKLGLSTTALGSDRNAVVFAGKVAKGFEPDHSQTLLVNGGASGRVEQGQLPTRCSARPPAISGGTRRVAACSSACLRITGFGSTSILSSPSAATTACAATRTAFRPGKAAGSSPPKNAGSPTGIPFASSMSAARCSTTWGRPRAATVSRHPPRSRSRTRRACCGMSASGCASASADRPSAPCCTSTSHTRSTV